MGTMTLGLIQTENKDKAAQSRLVTNSMNTFNSCYEIQQVMLALQIETKNKRNGSIYYFNTINDYYTVIFSWLRRYLKTEEDEFHHLEIKIYFYKTTDLYIEIISSAFPRKAKEFLFIRPI